ncbi:hypothetical protein BDZ89DRAFT_706961 [Hymenopellis radicata]|nr:hypothetical protein BDZ89DRAFT_706961 [Hymenopellis radicata]
MSIRAVGHRISRGWTRWFMGGGLMLMLNGTRHLAREGRRAALKRGPVGMLNFRRRLKRSTSMSKWGELADGWFKFTVWRRFLEVMLVSTDCLAPNGVNNEEFTFFLGCSLCRCACGGNSLVRCESKSGICTRFARVMKSKQSGVCVVASHCCRLVRLKFLPGMFNFRKLKPKDLDLWGRVALMFIAGHNPVS